MLSWRRGLEVVDVVAKIALCPSTTPQGRLKERVARFCAGEWVPLLEMSLECSVQGNVASRRRRRRATDDLQCRVGRALGLAQMGELSHARRALEGEPVVPSTENTWKANEAKRPRTAEKASIKSCWT